MQACGRLALGTVPTTIRCADKAAGWSKEWKIRLSLTCTGNGKRAL